MSDFMFIAAVTGVFFLFGVAFAVLGVIAASALRTDAERAARKAERAARQKARRERKDPDQPAGWIGTEWAFRGGWTDSIEAGQEGPGPDREDAGGGPPRWPGGFGGR